MSNYAVLRGAAYTLAAAPDMVLHNGTTQTIERVVNPGSDYLKELPGHLRNFEDVISYAPNQVYIGNMTTDELDEIEFPWYEKKVPKAEKKGRLGEIIEQDELLGLIQICDVFDLVWLEKGFAEEVKAKLKAHELIGEEKVAVLDKNKDGVEDIMRLAEKEQAEPLYHGGKLVGAVKRAHDVDANLSAHVMLENLVTKASGVLSILNLVKTAGIRPSEVEYVIDCCEEACGDMNQRGGGNFAKAAAEIAGLTNASGSDTRGFCAGPVHALLNAASLVKAGTFKNVVVAAGGCSAKLGMNGKDHVKKGMPIMEDTIAGFAVLISENDGVSPQIRTDIVGKHSVGTGASPQDVISALVTEPLDKAGMKLKDIDKFSPEMQNPDITKPAGAGDVPAANYKMIAALGVKRGELQRAEIQDFVKNHGMTGWAPTQGHIPSGVPYLGMARDDIISGKIKRVMIIGKGSLFLGRMTNLFDGVSFVIEKNPRETENIGETESGPVSACGSDPFKEKNPVIGIFVSGSEHGIDDIKQGTTLATNNGYKALVIEGEDSHDKMDEMLQDGRIEGAVTMHYPFPIGVSTVGRVITPAKGKEMFLATTTGTSDTDRAASLVKNAIYGIITAKAYGVENPTVGIANIDGARKAESALIKLADNGYEINFAESARAEGGTIMRGNDFLMGSPDVMVTDALTGNLMMKMFSAFNSGGEYETVGYGYGPGIGKGYDKLILIVSRASGAPVIAGAVSYAAQLIKRGYRKVTATEFSKVEKAGFDDIINEMKRHACKASAEGGSEAWEEAKMPEKEVVDKEISGIEVMDIEDAVDVLWKEGIYAESGMGCTGPVVMINAKNEERAGEILSAAGYL